MSVSLTSCSDDEAATTTPTDGPLTVKVTIADGVITPNGDRISAEVGQDIVFEITSDVPGELHVHSEPEYEFEFKAGYQTEQFTIDTPGLVDVELHDPELTLVQLEVR